MFATVRRYAGLSEASLTALIGRAAHIGAVLASVPGVHRSQLIRTREGVILITLGADEPSLAESGRRFRAWIDDHVPEFRSANEADVWAGQVVYPGPGAPTSTEGEQKCSI